MGGTAGTFYRQFGITMAISIGFLSFECIDFVTGTVRNFLETA